MMNMKENPAGHINQMPVVVTDPSVLYAKIIVWVKGNDLKKVFQCQSSFIKVKENNSFTIKS